MKILVVHNKYKSRNIGGEDIVYMNELKSLQSKLGKDNVLSYEVSNDDINMLKLPFHVWFSIEHYNNIKKIVRQNKIDIVHVHNFFPLLTPSIFKAAKDAGAIVIHTLHNYRIWCISGILYRDGFGICEECVAHHLPLSGILNKCYRNSLIQSFIAQMAFWFYKFNRLFDYIDYFFVLTNFQKEKVKHFGIDERKLILKPNGLPMSFKINKERNGYIYIGRLEESKGIYELLNTWNQLDEKFVLTIIGTGEIEEQLRAKYKKPNIIFKGKCNREDTLKHIASSKYLIQPSLLYETFGLTIIEAMSFGVPVIGFDIGTRRDFIKDGINGFLCDIQNLKQTIEKSFDYPSYEELSKNAIETAKQYENDYVIMNQIRIYQKILEDKL